MFTLILKGVLSLLASFLLIASTPVESLCYALRRLHVPSVIVTLLLLTYRYVGVLTEEASVMTDAYHLRAPGQKGIHRSAWGSFFGQLLLRSMDRAEDLYSSMQLRGFGRNPGNEFTYAAVKSDIRKDVLIPDLYCIYRTCKIRKYLAVDRRAVYLTSSTLSQVLFKKHQAGVFLYNTTYKEFMRT